MQTIDKYFRDYDSYHQTKGNKLTHVVGISMIVISLLGLLDRIEFFHWEMSVKASPALLLFLAGNAFYLMLDLKVGFAMILATGISYFVGSQLSANTLWGLFIGGWVLQAIGHIVYEKKSPAFAKNLIHLLVGPAYLLNYYLRIHSVR